MIGHRLMGMTLLETGDIEQGRAHFDRAIELYDPAKHRPLAMRFGIDSRVSVLSFRSLALWMLGDHQAALRDTEYAVKDAREIGQAASLMYALIAASLTHACCGKYTAAVAVADELIALAEEKGTSFYKASGVVRKGCLLVQTGRSSDAVQMITTGIIGLRSTGSTLWMPHFLSCLAMAYAEIGNFDEAWRSIGQARTAIDKNKETWFEADVHRVAGEIALKSPDIGSVKGETYFEQALAIARQQQAKSWELRAAMSMARLWRDQGKRDEARELLAPVYGWFTEGFDTLDLKEAKALLDELAACEVPVCEWIVSKRLGPHRSGRRNAVGQKWPSIN
jgi:predicted ATPase